MPSVDASRRAQFYGCKDTQMSCGGSGDIVTGVPAGRPWNRRLIRVRGRHFIPLHSVWTAF